jgi:hypothetical protein
MLSALRVQQQQHAVGTASFQLIPKENKLEGPAFFF